MNPLVELNLTLILFLPWFAILATLYWLFPRQPRHAARRLYDSAALLLSLGVFLCSVYWSMRHADARVIPPFLADTKSGAKRQGPVSASG